MKKEIKQNRPYVKAKAAKIMYVENEFPEGYDVEGYLIEHVKCDNPDIVLLITPYGTPVYVDISTVEYIEDPQPNTGSRYVAGDIVEYISIDTWRSNNLYAIVLAVKEFNNNSEIDNIYNYKIMQICNKDNIVTIPDIIHYHLGTSVYLNEIELLLKGGKVYEKG